jgi:hypothetical protein
MLRGQGFSADKIDEAMQCVRTDLLLVHDGESQIRLCRYAGTGRLAPRLRVCAMRYARRVNNATAYDEMAERWSYDPASDRLTGELGQRFKAAFATAPVSATRTRRFCCAWCSSRTSPPRGRQSCSVSKSTCRQLADVERRLVKHLSAVWREQTAGSPARTRRDRRRAPDLSMSRLLRES